MEPTLCMRMIEKVAALSRCNSPETRSMIIELQRMTKQLQQGWLNLASRLYAVERYWNAHGQEMAMEGWGPAAFERAVLDGKNPLKNEAFTEFWRHEESFKRMTNLEETFDLYRMDHPNDHYAKKRA